MGGICGKSNEAPRKLFATEIIRAEREADKTASNQDFQVISLARVFNMLAYDNNSAWGK